MSRPPGSPTLHRRGRVFTMEWDSGIMAHVSNLRQQRTGDWRADVAFLDGDFRLHSSTFNLNTDTGRKPFINALSSRNGGKPWGSMVQDLCSEVLHSLNEGEPLAVIDTSGPVKASPYLLDPVLPYRQPTLLFARGGRGKSYLALYLALILQVPLSKNPFHWKPAWTTPTLFLDWEADSGALHLRAKRLIRGLGIGDVKLNYRRCCRPLVDEIESIERMLVDTKAGLVVIDSVGVALGGDPSDPGKVNDFFGAVRELDTTVLLIHHEAKNDMAKIKTPFGSVYFENLARSVWHLDKAQEAGANEILLSMEHTKSNDSILHKPVGIAVRFDNEMGKTWIEPADLQGTAFEDRLPLTERIASELKAGPQTVAELAEVLEKDPASIRARLNDGRKKGEFTKIDDNQWGLTYHE